MRVTALRAGLVSQAGVVHSEPMMVSPVAIVDRPSHGWVDLLISGRVTAADGTPVPEAVLTVRGYQIGVDAQANFEILTAIPARGQPSLEVHVTAPGYRPRITQLKSSDAAATSTTAPDKREVYIRSTRLADGTPVMLYDFVL